MQIKIGLNMPLSLNYYQLKGYEITAVVDGYLIEVPRLAPDPIVIQGPQGEKGEKGDTGERGIIGLTGERGPTGLTGAAGPQGETGATGAAGPQGETGATGAAGPNEITDSTDTSFNGVIAGDGTHARVAIAADADALILLPTVGTYNPEITFGGNAVDVTYGTLRTGRYIKIGKMVLLFGILQLTSKGSSTGQVLISLPFQPSAYSSISMRLESMASGATGHIQGLVSSALSGIRPELFAAGAMSLMTNAHVANNSIFIYSGVYTIA